MKVPLQSIGDEIRLGVGLCQAQIDEANKGCPTWRVCHARYERAARVAGNGFEVALYSAAFNWNPRSIMSAGRTGYSPEKQASQNCGSLASRPPGSPQAR